MISYIFGSSVLEIHAYRTQSLRDLYEKNKHLKGPVNRIVIPTRPHNRTTSQ